MKHKTPTGEGFVDLKNGRRRRLPLVSDTKKDVFSRILAFRGRIKLAKGETIKDLVNAGRKY